MRTLIKLIIALAILAMIAILAYNRFGPDDAEQAGLQDAVAPAPSKAEPQYPVPADPAPPPAREPAADTAADAPADEPEPAPEPLPSLAESDEAAAEAVREVYDASLVDVILRPKNLVRHVVVTLDNLDRAPIPLRFRPIEPVDGEFVVDGGDAFTTGMCRPSPLPRPTPWWTPTSRCTHCSRKPTRTWAIPTGTSMTA